jgi:alkaline phosphatase
MKFMLLLTLFCSTFVSGFGQIHTSSSIFAHNDYTKPIPLQVAFQYEVGYIEVDVFLRGDDLVVAHTRLEINQTKTIDKIYLEPLAKLIADRAFIYPDSTKKLILMVDMKTSGEATLNALVNTLQKYPSLLSCKNFSLAVSGEVPPPSVWKNYPDFIHFDGRPTISYTDDELKRISLISANFKDYSNWNGKGELNKRDIKKITEVVNSAHLKGKPFRFWATPDTETAWSELIKLNVDILNTDDVTGLATFLKNRKH